MWVVTAALLVFSALLATNYDLDYPLITVGSTPLSNSGTNTICLPYVLPAGMVSASDLMTAINGASVGGDEVISIAKFVVVSDTLRGYTGTVPENDFALVPGEGYRIQVAETLDYNILGSDDDTLSLNFYGPGILSASGTTDYCPPFNRISNTASELRDEINAKFTGNPPIGSVVSVSKFLIGSDTLQVFAGDPADDFELRSGESYRVVVSADVNLIPEVFDVAVNVEIEGRPPAPCGATNDGGALLIRNVGSQNDVWVKWHGGDPESEIPPDAGDGFTTLIFLPTTGPEQCVESGGCTGSTFPTPSNDAAGCEFIRCNMCGCEISDGMRGECPNHFSFTRCDNDDDCGLFPPCVFKGALAPGGRTQFDCNQTHCTPNITTPPEPEEPPFCPAINFPSEGTNCCDQQFIRIPGLPNLCLDPSVLKCTELVVGAEFFVSAVSIDHQNWIDVEDRGIAPDSLVSVKETNCCDFVCVNLANPESSSCTPSCTLGSCSNGETCVSSCDGECSESGGLCSSSLDCTLGGVTDTCVRPCQGL